MSDTALDWALDRYLESHQEELVDESQGCYWHNDPECACDEPQEFSDADEGL